MQSKPSQWVPGYKHGPAASYTQITRMGLFLNVATSKFEPLDSTWDNLHSGGMFISDDNKIYFRDETNKDIYINSPADNQLALYASSGVGVNVTPTEMLHVVDATAEGGVLIDNTATDGNPILAFGLSGTKTFTMGIDDGDSDKFKIFSGAAIDGTSEFVIDSAGDVGIGTDDPQHKLHVYTSGTSTSVTGNVSSTFRSGAAGRDVNIQLSDSSAAAYIGNLGGAVYIYTGSQQSLNIATDGAITAPLQPAFLAQANSTQGNIAIDSYVEIVFGAETFDQGGDFASNTFTAPVTGKYQLSTVVRLTSVDSAAVYYTIRINTSNNNFMTIIDPTQWAGDLNNMSRGLSVLADMDASDTATIEFYQSGGTAQTDIPDSTVFSGYLAC
jgi:hypothetical protein